jgi:hypothetical protein
MIALGLLAFVFAITGCGSDESSPVTGPPDAGPPECDAGQMPLDDGRCQPAGLPLDMQCDVGELPLENGGCQPAGLPPDMPCPPGEIFIEGGGCRPAGVPPDACAEGFEANGKGGCDPILPAAPCPPGQMAVPGETQCREVAPCGNGDYGTIPVEPTTQFVNAAYPGADSNGTQAKPWKTIQAGIDKAGSGVIVAVAAGTYTGDLLIKGKRIRLWGRCPAMVSVTGTGAAIAAVTIIYDGASQSELHSLAITGPSAGVGTSGSSDVLVDRVRIHDTLSRGLDINGALGPSSITVSNSLIEAAGEAGVSVGGSVATIEATVVRDTQASSNGANGRGINVQANLTTDERSTLTVRRSLLERNVDFGVYVLSSDAEIDATVVRDTKPRKDGTSGHGVSARDSATTKERSTLTLRASVVEQNHEVGVSVVGSDAAIEATVVRATQPGGDGGFGHGISSISSALQRPKVAVRASLVEQNHEVGVSAWGSDTTIEATVVRATQPRSDGTAGSGVQMRVSSTTDERSALTLRASVVEQNHEAGVIVEGSDALIDGTIVRATQSNGDGTFGHGVEIVGGAKVTIHASVVEQNHEIGVFVGQGSEATIEGAVVRDTQLNGDMTLGRGIDVNEDPITFKRSTLTVRASLLEGNHESGVTITGSDATIDGSVVRDTQPLSDGSKGHGIAIQHSKETFARATLTLRASLLEENRALGFSSLQSDATIEATVIRNTQPNGDGLAGRGIEIREYPPAVDGSTLTLRSSVLEHNHDVGILIGDSDAWIEGTLVRDTKSSLGGLDGMGIAIQSSAGSLERSTVDLRGSVVENNHDIGVLVIEADVTIDATVVRATQRQGDGTNGRGIGIESSATLKLYASLVEENHEVGVFIGHSDAIIEETVVRATQTESDGTGGDGIAVTSLMGPATAIITSTRIEDNARAGIASFSAAVVLVSSTVQCNLFDLNGEDFVEGQAFTFDGSKDNLCGCSDKPDPTCPVVSENLSAPEAIPPVKPSN